ncbi:MAG TPA: hypothetical protein PK250_11715 [Syntrophobacter fumaroxidans]|nr:hypothetical protein [Syntrophobacter fumaroxidans]
MMVKTAPQRARNLLLIVLAVGTMGFFGPKLVPEMKELLDAFSNRVQRAAILEKYGEQGVVPRELTMCDMARPVVTASEQRDGIAYYTLESRVEKCEHSEAAAGTVRIFVLGWKNGRIVGFAWGGPKGGKVEY